MVVGEMEVRGCCWWEWGRICIVKCGKKRKKKWNVDKHIFKNLGTWWCDCHKFTHGAHHALRDGWRVTAYLPFWCKLDASGATISLCHPKHSTLLFFKK